MADFVDDYTDPPETKVDATSVAAGASTAKYVRAADINNLSAASTSLRTGILNGKVHGLRSNASASVGASGQALFRSNSGILETSEDGKRWTPVKDYVSAAKHCARDGVTNDSPGIMAAKAECLARGVRTLYIPEGSYNIGTSLDFTGLQGFHILMPGIQAQLNGTCTGKAIFDLTGSLSVRITGGWIYGDQTNMPSAGILCGRNSTASSGYHTFDKVTLQGYYGVANYAGISSEQNMHINPAYFMYKVGANCFVQSITNDWASANYQYSGQPALVSDYTTLLTNPVGGNTVHAIIGGFVASATPNTDVLSTVMYLRGIRGFSIPGAFLQGYGKYGVYFAGDCTSVNLTGVGEDEFYAQTGYYIAPGVTVDRLVMDGFINQLSPFVGGAGATLKNSRIHAQFGQVVGGADAGYSFVVDNLKDSEINLMSVGAKIRTLNHDNIFWGNSSSHVFPTDTLGCIYQTQAGDPAGSGHTIHTLKINDSGSYDERVRVSVLNGAGLQKRPQYLTSQSGTITPSYWNGSYWDIGMTGNVTIANPSAGPTGNAGLAHEGVGYTFVFRQDATGGRTVTWGSQYKNAGNWQPNSAASSVSSIDFVLAADNNYYVVGQWNGRVVGSDFYLTAGTLNTDSSSRTVNLTHTTTNLTLTNAHDYVVVNCTSGSVVITLPTSPTRGRRYKIHRTDNSANTVTVSPAGGATIDGAASATLAFLATYELVWDPNNSAWFYFGN